MRKTSDTTLIAFRWQTLIDEGHFSNVNKLANAIGKDSAFVEWALRLTLRALPILWSEQKKLPSIE